MTDGDARCQPTSAPWDWELLPAPRSLRRQFACSVGKVDGDGDEDDGDGNDHGDGALPDGLLKVFAPLIKVPSVELNSLYHYVLAIALKLTGFLEGSWQC